MICHKCKQEVDELDKSHWCKACRRKYNEAYRQHGSRSDLALERKLMREINRLRQEVDPP